MNYNGKHLTYCLNIHPGETLAEVKQAVDKHAVRVKQAVSPERPFGLGLRLSNQASLELLSRTEEFKHFLSSRGMYAFTVNGFPYGPFHHTRVKDNVYAPDWSRPERYEYTLRLAQIMAALLPEGELGTISTVPVRQGKSADDQAVDHLVKMDKALVELRSDTGRDIKLALEPEPGCMLETAAECVDFWKNCLQRTENLGICFDTCHFAANFENPLAAWRRLINQRIPVFKVQISSALRLSSVTDLSYAKELLTPFASDVYLHQVRIKDSNSGGVRGFSDLPSAFESGGRGEWRLHFHVPLHWPGAGPLKSTSDEITCEFLAEAGRHCSHYEVETYTYSQLPGKKQPIEESITREIEWVLQRQQ